MAKLCPVSGKKKYQSNGDALGWASNYLSRFDGPSFLRAYKCPHCGSWHLTKLRTYVSFPTSSGQQRTEPVADNAS
jgi:DNA-directed RNA polymerase subunit RPC12/RpoP